MPSRGLRDRNGSGCGVSIIDDIYDQTVEPLEAFEKLPWETNIPQEQPNRGLWLKDLKRFTEQCEKEAQASVLEE
jgi:hypothetical protein